MLPMREAGRADKNYELGFKQIKCVDCLRFLIDATLIFIVNIIYFEHLCWVFLFNLFRV